MTQLIDQQIEQHLLPSIASNVFADGVYTVTIASNTWVAPSIGFLNPKPKTKRNNAEPKWKHSTTKRNSSKRSKTVEKWSENPEKMKILNQHRMSRRPITFLVQ